MAEQCVDVNVGREKKNSKDNMQIGRIQIMANGITIVLPHTPSIIISECWRCFIVQVFFNENGNLNQKFPNSN